MPLIAVLQPLTCHNTVRTFTSHSWHKYLSPCSILSSPPLGVWLQTSRVLGAREASLPAHPLVRETQSRTGSGGHSHGDITSFSPPALTGGADEHLHLRREAVDVREGSSTEVQNQCSNQFSVGVIYSFIIHASVCAWSIAVRLAATQMHSHFPEPYFVAALQGNETGRILSELSLHHLEGKNESKS